MLRVGGFLLFGFALVFGMFDFVQAEGVGIGISPANIDITNAIPHVTRRERVTLVRSGDISEALLVDVEIRDRSRVASGELEVLFPPGMDRIDYEIRLTPGDKLLYELEIDFLPRTGTVSDIRSGVTLSVRMETSGEPVVGYRIRSLFAFASEERSPLYIGYALQNTGNVSWRPELVTADVYKETGAYVKTVQVAGENIGSVQPGEIREVRMDLGNDISSGMYTIAMRVTYDGVDVFFETISAIVQPEGSLVQNGEIVSFQFAKTSYGVGETAKLVAPFMNTGDVTYDVVLTTEVYRDNMIVDVYRTRPRTVYVGETVELFQLMSGREVGTHEVVGYVTFGQRTTGTVRTKFDVQKVTLSRTIDVALIVLVILFCLFLLLFLVVRRRRLYLAPPHIFQPIRVHAKTIAGRCRALDGTKVTVLINGESIGEAEVVHSMWSLSVPEHTLVVGARVNAVACRKERGYDRVCTSERSHGVVVRA